VSPKAATFWPITLGVLFTDYTTKRLAVEYLSPAYSPHDIIGSVVRFTLAFNPGAAFSMSLGGASRWGFTLAAVLALGVLSLVYRGAKDDDVAQSVAIALIAGGALGNLADRLRSVRGVVDFIDIGINDVRLGTFNVGDVRFWTFNVADMGVTCGAVLLVWVLWQRGRD
jgi:signal peptidase II